jgi:beta-mannosidase
MNWPFNLLQDLSSAQKMMIFSSWSLSFRRIFLLCILQFFFSMLISQSSLVLNLSDSWEFRQSGSGQWYPATVPGTVHTDLLANQLIEDPFYRNNEKKLQWIDKTDWEYRSTFTLSQDWMEQDVVKIECKGLDTYADVYINQQKVLSAHNFFRTWEVDIKSVVKEGVNEILIRFHSPIRKGLELLAHYGIPLPADNDQSITGGVGDHQVSIFTRKPGYHYGWDWGPRLVTSGIWQPVVITGRSNPKIVDLFFKQKSITDEQASLTAIFTISSLVAGDYFIVVQQDGEPILESSHSLRAGVQQLELPFQIQNPKRWWTRELGTPHLYDLSGQLLQNNQTLDSVSHKIGLREIKVVQQADAKGSSFYFELNGVPIFAKGANYIPNDVFIPRFSDEAYRQLIQSAVDANMNMLRIWGGGFYEKDIFYDLCDEQGILVWQDFMFACSMYPGNAEFLENVEQEAIENIQRLRNHPCVTLWCGNNENDVAWSQFEENGGWGWKQRFEKETRTKIWEDYEQLFHQLLPALVEEHHPDIFYWPSSPYATDATHATYTSTHGDIHYWGVWHGQQLFDEFQNHIGRFMSEYGFQSFPEFPTVQQFTLPEDWDIESEVMMAHQRSGIGNLRIREYMEHYFDVPDDFEDLLYVGQLLQAKGIREAIEAHRRAKPYCMGTLYWQFNDCWPAASWSSMDYTLRWKALQFEVKKAFEPLLISSFQEKERLQVFLVSDLLQDEEYKVEFKLLDFRGNVLLKRNESIQVESNFSSIIQEFELNEFRKKDSLNKVFLSIQLTQEKEVVAETVHYFVAEKELVLSPDYQLKKELRQIDEQTYEIVLMSDHLLKGLRLSIDGVTGRFSDNYFDLPAGEDRKVLFHLQEPSEKIKKNHLRHRCLQDL